MTELLFGTPISVIDCPDEKVEEISNEVTRANLKFNKNLATPWDSNILTTFNREHKVNIIKDHCPILCSYVLKSTNQFLKDLQITPNYSFIDIYDSWINYAETGMYQEVHSHPYADISGVFYSETDSDSGDIYFIAPSTSYCHSELIFRSNILRDNIKIQSKKNRLILFPSWLQHGTLMNKSKNTRISISFNIKLIP
jgi:uncharacterized protein (TIGR02466 family)